MLLCLSSQVPCSLEYWDELQQAFVPYREFSLSESTACQLQLPSLSLTDQQKELVASDLWRIVLNNNGEGGDEQRWQKNVLYFVLIIHNRNNILFLCACRYLQVVGCMFVCIQSFCIIPHKNVCGSTCTVQCEGKQRESAPRPPSTKSSQCVPRPTSGVQEQGAGLEGVQIGLMRFPSTPSACQGPSGFLPAYLECI